MADRNLADFEGREVVAVGVEMPNAAGGLQAAMKFDPVELHHGEEGFIVLHYRTEKVRFDPVEKGTVEPLRRVHVLHVDQAAPVDGEIVEQAMDEYQQRIARLKDEAEGKMAIPGFDGPRGEFQKLTVPQLKKLCKDQTPPLSQAGGKKDLIQRLIDNDVEPPTAPEPE